ncbi:unnamed protein product [Chrysoparadoxa australica]
MKACIFGISCLLACAHVCHGFTTPVALQKTAWARQSSLQEHTTAVARYRRVRPSSSQALQMGLFDGLLKTGEEALGMRNEAVVAKMHDRVVVMNGYEDALEALSDEELREKTNEFRGRVEAGESLDSILEEAFAVVREAAWRVLGLRLYDVQLIGGIAMHEGCLTEMATGEGKTLAATLPAYLRAMAAPQKGGVFVVTANDYLARRDAESMGQVHRFLGLTVGLVQTSMTETARQEAYGCDITYVTNQELGFDYLRDHLSLTKEGVVQVKPFYFCLVDEADSILIDEARTPLIISKKVPAPVSKFATCAKISGVLQPKVHYNANEKDQSVLLTDKGYSDVEKILGKTMFDPADPWAPYVINALKAKELFTKDKDYIVEGTEVKIVDAFSGRVLEGRRYSDGLHQSIEAKENIKVSTQSQVTAQVTYQGLFRTFEALAGMTGTAITDAQEFATTYGLNVVPTMLPVARRDYPDVVFGSQDAALVAMLNEVMRVSESGRPILIGTTSVAMSERVVQKLQEQGAEPQTLNAKPEQVERESEIVAQAGRLGQITVATNMAGRGTDILLGGNPAEMAKIKVRDTIGAAVLSEEDAAALPKASESFYPCELEENEVELLSKAVAACVKAGAMTRDALEELVAVAAGSGPTSDALALTVRAAVSGAKKSFAEAMSEEKKQVINLGGLYVLGTSRHESRRIDNQLRGRAGRQGDPGASRFFLSLEDDIFRVFGGDKMRKIMDTFRLGDDIPIENKGVSDTLDKVQKQTEAYFAGIRRTVLEFDGLVNEQRLGLYETRDGILMGDTASTEQLIEDYVIATVRDIVPGYTKDGIDAPGLAAKLDQFFPGSSVVPSEMASLGVDELTGYCEKAALAAWQAKKSALDSKRPGLACDSARFLILSQMDDLWANHLERMGLLKESVSMEVYRGRNPLDEFKLEGRELFKGLLSSVRLNSVYSLFQYSPPQ